jgi:hypothetical protein
MRTEFHSLPQASQNLPEIEQACLMGEPALFPDIAAQDFVDEVAGLLDFWDGKADVNLLAVAAGTDHSRGSKNCQVLRQIGFGHTDSFLDVRHSAFPFANQVQQVQQGGVGEGLADGGLALENFVLDGVIPAALHGSHFLGCETKLESSAGLNAAL